MQNLTVSAQYRQAENNASGWSMEDSSATVRSPNLLRPSPSKTIHSTFYAVYSTISLIIEGPDLTSQLDMGCGGVARLTSCPDRDICRFPLKLPHHFSAQPFQRSVRVIPAIFVPSINQSSSTKGWDVNIHTQGLNCSAAAQPSLADFQQPPIRCLRSICICYG